MVALHSGVGQVVDVSLVESLLQLMSPLVTLYGLTELYLGVTGTQQGVAHFAHLGGMVAGFLLVLYWRALRR